MSKELVQVLSVGGRDIHENKDGMVSLTDLYRATRDAGLADGKQSPGEWARRDGQQFIDFLEKKLNTAKCRIFNATRGRHGSTFAHRDIALAYAKYLSPELHLAVNSVYFRAATGDVTLAAEISDRATTKDRAWLARRISTTITRNEFTSALNNHGVTGKGYADATNAIYSTLLGGERKQVCISKGFPPSTNLRDIMDIEELCRTQLAEIVSVKNINKLNARGNKECTAICHISARKVAEVQ